jgi:hypothetical protein
VIYLTATLKADVDVLKMSQDKFLMGFEGIKSVPGLIYAATYEPYPASLLEIGAGRNSLGIQPDEPLVLLLLYASWSNDEDDENVVKVNKQVLEEIKNDAEITGQLHPYTYMNYAFPGQDPITSYGSVVKEDLIKVSSKYDPKGFFQKSVSGGFKLS